MTRNSFILTLSILVAAHGCLCTEFTEEQEAGVTAHTPSVDDYQKPVRTALFLTVSCRIVRMKYVRLHVGSLWRCSRLCVLGGSVWVASMHEAVRSLRRDLPSSAEARNYNSV